MKSFKVLKFQSLKLEVGRRKTEDGRRKTEDVDFSSDFGLRTSNKKIYKFIPFAICLLFTTIFFLALTPFYSNAQKTNPSSGTLTTAVMEEPIYYIHKVEKKQTLYSIAKTYHVDIAEIVLANPESDKKIIIGQLLRIPIDKVKPSKPSAINPDSIDYKRFMVHQVVKGQTLYSLAVKYGLSVEEIAKANPQMEGGLKYGEIIVIPRKNVSTTETEKKTEPVVVPESNNNIKLLSHTFKVALMLPFYLSKNDSLEEAMLLSEEEAIYPSSEIAIKFYQGVLMAVDSIKKSGLNVKLYVYDTANDSALVQNIIHKPEFKELDLIIGPFFPSTIVMVADSAKKYNIPVASPFSNSDLLLSKENIIKSTPSKNAEIKYLSTYIDTAFNGQNIILLHNNSAEENKLIADYKKCIQDSTRFKVINYSVVRASGIDPILSSDKKNAIVIFSTHEDFVTNVITKLNSRRNSYDIHLFSLSSLEKLKNLEVQYLQNLNYEYTTPFFVNYQQKTIQEFVASFQEHYKADPDKYAITGFDLSYYLFGLMKSNGKKFMNQIADTPSKSIHTSYLFSRLDKTSALENTYYSIIKFDNYHLVKVN